jgi:hypothetical protein
LKRAAKNEWVLQELKACNETVLPGKGDRKNPCALWKLATKLKNGLGKWKKWDDSNFRNVDGDMASTPEENASIFQDSFTNLFSNDYGGDDVRMGHEKMPKAEVDRQWGAPTMKEMMDELEDVKHTAAGASGMPSVAWQACGENEDLRMAMLKVLKGCWDHEKVPEEWTEFHMTVLFKKGKKGDVANYRGVSMAETSSKLCAAVLKRRLGSYYEPAMPECCNGFRRGRGRHDSIYMLKECLRKRKAKGLDSCCIFFDCAKAFDEISRECAWQSMEVMGVDSKMTRAAQATLKDTTCKMNIGGVVKVVNVKEGTGQGTTLGPTLCNFFFLPILLQFERMLPHS